MPLRMCIVYFALIVVVKSSLNAEDSLIDKIKDVKWEVIKISYPENYKNAAGKPLFENRFKSFLFSKQELTIGYLDSSGKDASGSLRYKTKTDEKIITIAITTAFDEEILCNAKIEGEKLFICFNLKETSEKPAGFSPNAHMILLIECTK